ncbi:MAG: peptidoglycan DD-metalloendopeptidase family protein [Spirochaetes bacterium]|nr:peptidoglycan DD-metalloendopeptidase family protein [Spirochaetota bacterium]
MRRVMIVTAMACILVIAQRDSRPQEQDPVDTIIQGDKSRRQELVMRDQEHQKRIMAKINGFFNRVKRFAPDLSLKSPMHPGYAERVTEKTTDSRYARRKAHYAYLGEPYRLRSGPSDREMKGAVKLPRGARLMVLMMPKLDESAARKNVTERWVLVRTSGNVEGYVPLDLLMAAPPSGRSFEPSVRGSVPGGNSGVGGSQDGASGSDGTPKKMRVTADVLNVRYEPNTDSSIIDRVQEGAIIEVLSMSEHSEYIDGHDAKWAKIQYRYIEGWVFSAYLSDNLEGDGGSGGRGEDMQEFSSGQRLYVKSDILRVRDAPSDEGTVLFSLQHRDQVEVTEVTADTVSLAGRKSKWVSVKHDDYDGWVFGAFLSERESAYEEGDDIDRMFIFPFNDQSLPITSNFGWRTLRGVKNYHQGIDIGAALGTPVLASADGTVILTRFETRNGPAYGYGTYVILEHRGGHRTLYGHLSELSAKDGEKYYAGDVLGKVGNTGHSYGCHLHFEIRTNEEYVDPATYIHAFLDGVMEGLRYVALNLTMGRGMAL